MGHVINGTHLTCSCLRRSHILAGTRDDLAQLQAEPVAYHLHAPVLLHDALSLPMLAPLLHFLPSPDESS